jgi:hypothetical protein
MPHRTDATQSFSREDEFLMAGRQYLYRLEGPGGRLIRLTVDYITSDGLPIKATIRANTWLPQHGEAVPRDGPAAK